MCAEDPIRFGELKKRVGGITNTMLTSSLRELEDDGLVKRLKIRSKAQGVGDFHNSFKAGVAAGRQGLAQAFPPDPGFFGQLGCAPIGNELSGPFHSRV